MDRDAQRGGGCLEGLSREEGGSPRLERKRPRGGGEKGIYIVGGPQ